MHLLLHLFLDILCFRCYAYVHAELLQLCRTLRNPVDCSLTDFSLHGILQAGILEWVAMPSSRGSSQPKDRTCVSMSPALAVGSLPLMLHGKPFSCYGKWLFFMFLIVFCYYIEMLIIFYIYYASSIFC